MHIPWTLLFAARGRMSFAISWVWSKVRVESSAASSRDSPKATRTGFSPDCTAERVSGSVHSKGVGGEECLCLMHGSRHRRRGPVGADLWDEVAPKLGVVRPP